MMLANVGGWLHTLDPVILPISGAFAIRWYGLSYVLGFVIGAWLLTRLAKRGHLLVPPDRVIDAMMWLVGGVVVGGRLGYCLVYRPDLFVDFGGGFPFWGLLRLTEGGMASHGGLVGVVVAAWRISRGWKNPQTGEIEGRCSPLHVADAVALAAPIGLFLGRVANFVNGELLGRIVTQPASGETAPGWAVRFPQEILSGHNADVERTEAQVFGLLEIVRDFAPSVWNEDAAVLTPGRMIEAGWPIVLQKLHDGAPGLAERMEPLISARHPSQLYQAAAEGLAVGVVVWLVARMPRKPGVVGAWFLISYGVLRVITEFVRLPDDNFTGAANAITGPTPFGLSRGQWLSMLMALIGGGLLLRCSASDSEKLLGWGVPKAGASGLPAAEPADGEGGEESRGDQGE